MQKIIFWGGWGGGCFKIFLIFRLDSDFNLKTFMSIEQPSNALSGLILLLIMILMKIIKEHD